MQNANEALAVVDRAHPPRMRAANAPAYKEWYHFNVIDAGQALDLIVNLSLAGDVRSTGHGRADVIALVHTGRNLWHGGIDSFEGTAAMISEDALDLFIGRSGVRFRGGRYELKIELRDGELVGDIHLTPRSEPMMVWNDTPIGNGSINWLIVPHLDASGRLHAGHRSFQFSRSYGYHDHNWGHWRWGEDFAWTWGFAADVPSGNGSPVTTLVFDRTSDRSDAAAIEQTLALWRDGKLVKLFVRRMLRAKKEGRFAGVIRRIPGAMNLVSPGRVLNVPSALRVSARDHDDWLDCDYRVDAALQIAIPSEFGFGVTGLNETFGTMRVHGVIGGAAISYEARACFEFL
jgi:hypothetical protein